MNLLYISSYEPSLINGGVEHTTLKMAEYLSAKYNHNCYSLYYNSVGESTTNIIFKDAKQIEPKDSIFLIKEYVHKNSIDIIIVQGLYSLLKDLKDNVEIKTKIIYVHHSDPLYDTSIYNIDYLLFKIKHQKGLTKLPYLRILLFLPLYKKYFASLLRKKLVNCATYSDKVVLLSKPAIKSFLNITGDKFANKITSINNPLSYDISISEKELQQKKKQVIMVCRIEERSKKITMALDIWKKITKNKDLSEWVFNIIGDGQELDVFKMIVKQKRIERVNFLGKINPYEEYVKSSIFFMTSVSEGWGITTTEAMQMGCVPIAFNNYSSIHEIIQDGENGYLVKFHDNMDFANKVIKLMRNCELRQKMAIKAIKSSQKYNMEDTGTAWDSLIKSLN